MESQTTSKLEIYEKLTEALIMENDLGQNPVSLESRCQASLRKIGLAHRFAEIDEDILNLSIKSSECTGGFFTGLIYLEAKRLKFKEETTKCPAPNQTKKIMKNQGISKA